MRISKEAKEVLTLVASGEAIGHRKCGGVAPFLEDQRGYRKPFHGRILKALLRHGLVEKIDQTVNNRGAVEYWYALTDLGRSVAEGVPPKH